MGAIYILKQERRFTIIRIEKVGVKNISYTPNDYHVSTVKMLNSINQPENYTDNLVQITKKEFKKMKLLNFNTQAK